MAVAEASPSSPLLTPPRRHPPPVPVGARQPTSAAVPLPRTRVHCAHVRPPARSPPRRGRDPGRSASRQSPCAPATGPGPGKRVGGFAPHRRTSSASPPRTPGRSTPVAERRRRRAERKAQTPSRTSCAKRRRRAAAEQRRRHAQRGKCLTRATQTWPRTVESHARSQGRGGLTLDAVARDGAMEEHARRHLNVKYDH